MKICDEEKDKSRPLLYVDLHEGDVFAPQSDSCAVFIKTERKANRVADNAVSLKSGHKWTFTDNCCVILYPNACVKLGEPSE